MSLTQTDLNNIKALFEGRFNKVDGRLDKIDGRFDRVDGRLDKIDGRFDRVDGRLDRVDGRLDKIESDIDSLAAASKNQFDVVLSELATIKEDTAVIKDIVKDHSFRIARLEHRTA